MINIYGKPFLECQLELLKREGIEDIVLCVGHLGEQIEDYFGDGNRYGVNITYSFEDRPLGTAGALKKAEPLLDNAFFTLFGDSYLLLNFREVMSFFESHNKLALMTVYKNCDRYDKSNTAIEGNLVKRYSKQQRSDDMVYVEYGANIFTKKVLEMIPENQFYPFEKLSPRLIKLGELLAFEVNQRFYEIGSPEGLKECREYMESVN